jgi:hypothetical protein
LTSGLSRSGDIRPPAQSRGGAQEVCHELLQELNQRDDTQCVLLASANGEYPELFKGDGIIIGFGERPDEFLFLTRDYDDWWHKSGDPRVTEAFIEFLETIQADVVHFINS